MRRFAVLIGLCGCLPAERPAKPADWSSCLVTPAALTMEVRESKDSRAVIAEGVAGSVLSLHSRWGAGSALAVEHTWGELLIELPAELHRGEVITLDSSGTRKTSYAEGHAITSYRSNRVVGTVKVSEVSDATISLDVDVNATEPTIDVDHRNVVPMKGAFQAKRANQERACH